MSDLQHRIQAAEREGFALPDSLRQQVESFCDFAREAARDCRHNGGDDCSEAWDSIFDAERIIRNYAPKGQS